MYGMPQPERHWQPCVCPDEALQFIHQHTAGWLGNVSIMAVASDGSAKTKTVPVDRIDELGPFIESRNGTCNLYFGVNPLAASQDKKAAKDGIAALAYLHADLDPRDGFDLSAERERLKKLIDEFPIKPNLVIDSGGGYQVFWRLREHVLANGNIERLESYNQRIAALLAADHCWNIDRLMRLPGTVNLPDAHKRAKGRQPAFAQVVYSDEGAYGLEDLDALGGGTAGAQAHAEEHGAQPKISADDLRISEELKQLIRQGLPKGSRSEGLFRVQRAMVKVGHTDDEMVAVLMDPENKLSEKPRKMGRAWLLGEIGRAREKPDRGAGSSTAHDEGSNESKDSDSSARTGASADPSFQVQYRRLSDVQAKPIHWLWPGRFARGKVSMIAGHPGLGKSQVTLNMAAIVTTGLCWPDGTPSEPGSVVLLSAEDDAADTIRPRLEAAGADLDRCYILDAIRASNDEGKVVLRPFNLERDIERLEEMLRKFGDVALVVIDPITAYMGSADSHKNSDVRALLASLGDLAARYGVAIVCVTHLNKSVNADAALMRVMGSIGFVAAARAAYLVTRDEENEEGRLFLPLKNNIGNDRNGLAFSVKVLHILPSRIEATFIVWEDEVVTVTADQAMASPEGNDKPSATDEATAWLREILSAGPMKASDVKQQALEAGISEKVLRRAQQRLGIKPRKEGFDGGWRWSLPANEHAQHAQR